MSSMKAMDIVENIEKIIENYSHSDLNKKSTRVNLANEVYKNIVTNSPVEQNRNKQLLIKLAERLELGQMKYGKDIPRDDGRKWTKEALEEVLDAMIYISNVLLTIDEEG
tara:strand:- start:120 stop:449 length:330 start_codon:yes stop_codon:yes gene_type:complete